jgi:hypothetical protein
MGWPPSIPLNCERYIIGLVVNIRVGGLVTRPYWSTLKYPHYKKDVDPNVHVRVFQTVVKANGKTFEEYIINAFNYIERDGIILVS